MPSSGLEDVQVGAARYHRWRPRVGKLVTQSRDHPVSRGTSAGTDRRRQSTVTIITGAHGMGRVSLRLKFTLMAGLLTLTTATALTTFEITHIVGGQ